MWMRMRRPRGVTMDGSISRRLLLGTSLGGAAACVVARPAHALTTETIEPGSAVGLAYANRCTPDSAHAAIEAELNARLAVQAAPSGTTISASEVCPICGCPISVSRKVD